MDIELPTGAIDEAPSAIELGGYGPVLGCQLVAAKRIDGRRRTSDAASVLKDVLESDARRPADVLELTWSDALVEYVSADELAARQLQSRAATLRLATHRESTARGLPELVLTSVRHLRLKLDRPAENLQAAAAQLVSSLEDKWMPRPGLHRLDEAGRPAGLLAQQEAGEAPWLVLLHGTMNTSAFSFGDLFAKNWSAWQRHYGKEHILGLEHRTLTVSPIDNALDLVRALPSGAKLHLLSYSRGGLVGELLCHGGGLDEEHRRFFSHDAKTCEKLAELREQMKDKRIQVERFARVACPAAGSLLAGDRFDDKLNALLDLTALLHLDGPVHAFTRAVVLAVVATRARADLLPGLEAMMPESGLVAMLNSAPPRAGGELAVIAGDAQGGGMFDRLRAFCFDLYFQEPNDFVVDTRSMTRGLPRLEARGYVHRAPHVSHLSYFRNHETRGRIEDFLLRGDTSRLDPLDAAEPRPRLLHLLAELPRAPGPPDPAQSRPVVFLVPGIMGSHLAVAGERVWLHAARLVIGGLGDLPIERVVEPDGLVKLAYARLYRHLSRTHTVRPFPYDWRGSVKLAAERLAAAIAAELDAHDQPVRIVAHSMGGLVSRGLKAFHPEAWARLRARGGRLVMLGTPNRGAAVVLRIFHRRERLVHMLAALDSCHDLDALSAIVRAYPGLLEMLPRDETGDFLDAVSWQGAPDDVRPDVDRLAEARAVRDALDARGVDGEGMIYVAGLASDTPTARLQDGAIVFEDTGEGDGRVPWSLGRLDGVPAYYIDAVHGDMANDEPSYQGLCELLDRGSTGLLSRAPMQELRGAAQRTRAPRPVELRVFPRGEDVEAEALGMVQSEPELVRSVRVRVANGDLRRADHPVMVGHYLGDDIVSAEWIVDRQLGGQLSVDRQLGLYPGRLGTSRVFRGRPGALVVGLGEVGELTRLALLETVTSALCNLARARLDEVGSDRPVLVSVSSLLIGSYGGTKLSLEDSIGAILQAALDANRALEAQGLWEDVRIDSIQFVELFHDVAVRAAHIVRRLAASDVGLERRDRIAFVPTLQILPGARRQRPRSPYQSGWARRVRISTGERALSYDVVTDLARTEPVEQAVQWDMVRSLLERAPEASDPSVPAILFSYLVPRSIAAGARQGADLVLEVDRQAAQIPWELFDPRDEDDDAPLGARIGVVRQLRVEGARVPPEGARTRSALVIGEPRSSYPELPGARREAERVRARLQARGFDVVDKIQCSRDEILRALYERPDGYEILHIAGHGHRDDEPLCTGVVLEQGYLTAIELERIPRAPAVVFLNCCHLGVVDSATTTTHPGELAASLAEALIRAGVRVVVAAGWAVDDEAAAIFAEAFYDGLLDGRSLVAVARDARACAYEVSPHSTTWGAYHVYGDPGFVLESAGPSVDADAPAQEDVFVAREELLEVLEELAASAREACDARAARKAERIAARVEQLDGDCPDEWRDGPTLAAFGLVWNALGEHERAIAAYERSLASSAIALETVEQLARARCERAGELVAAGDVAGAQARIDRAIEELEALLAIAPSAQRLSLLGAAFKRKAQLDADGARRAALGRAADAYRRASLLAPSGLAYGSALEAAACGVALGWPDGDVVELLARAESDARAQERDQPAVWSRRALADASLVRLLCGEGEPASVVEAYRHAIDGGELATVREHLEFLSAMCERGDDKEQLERVRELLFA